MNTEMTYSDYIYIKNNLETIKLHLSKEAWEEYLRWDREFGHKIGKHKAEIYKLTREQTDIVENRIKKNTEQFKIIKTSKADEVLNKLRQDNYLDNLLNKDDD